MRGGSDGNWVSVISSVDVFRRNCVVVRSCSTACLVPVVSLTVVVAITSDVIETGGGVKRFRATLLVGVGGVVRVEIGLIGV